MKALAEFRNSGRLGQLLLTSGVLLLFAFLTIVGIATLMLYGVVKPSATSGGLQADQLLGRPDVVRFSVPGGTIEGWFFPGLRTAPIIVLAHNYLSNREEIITLATAFQEHQYNVFLFDFSGHGSSKRFSTLGFRETRELLAAIKAVTSRDDVDRTRVGIWGCGMGGYAAVTAAAQDPRIRAIAVYSLYERPEDLLKAALDNSALSAVPLAQLFSRFEFSLLTFSYRKDPPLSERVARLGNVSKMFITANNEPHFAAVTSQLFSKAPEPKVQRAVQRSRYASMMEEEKRSHESELISFFLSSLPIAAPPAQ
jgi:pimeloyl-ACP methyl ester carboxylesterase